MVMVIGISHKHCFQFFVFENNAYAKCWRDKNEHYGKFESGLFPRLFLPPNCACPLVPVRPVPALRTNDKLPNQTVHATSPFAKRACKHNAGRVGAIKRG